MLGLLKIIYMKARYVGDPQYFFAVNLRSVDLGFILFYLFIFLPHILVFIIFFKQSLFFLIDLYWSITASQYFVSFCCTPK